MKNPVRLFVYLAVVSGVGLGLFFSYIFYWGINPDVAGGKDLSRILSKDPQASFLPSVNNRDFWDNLTPKPKRLSEKEFQEKYGDASKAIALSNATRLFCVYPQDEFLLPIIELLILEIQSKHTLSSDGVLGARMVGLHSTTDSAVVANSLVLLGDRLNPKFVFDSKVWLNRNVLYPFLSEYQRAQRGEVKWWDSICPWMADYNNWTAVCVSNIVYVALASSESSALKSEVVNACIDLSEGYLNYFEHDGVCPGGIRYWTYGMYYFVLMAERLLQASGGEINLYDNPKVIPIINYSLETNLSLRGIGIDYPNFGDNIMQEPRVGWVHSLLAPRFNFPFDMVSPKDSGDQFSLYFDCYHSPYKVYTDPLEVSLPGKLTFYESNSLIIIRDIANDLVLAIKGGSNYEEHNHNDVGTYSLYSYSSGLGRLSHLVGDLGVEHYEPEHFRKDYRYSFDGLSSFGHPLPIVGNTLQSDGRKFSGQLVEHLSDLNKGIIVLDLTQCYSHPALESLLRIVNFRDGKLTVRDEFKASQPINMQTILPTRLIVDPQEKNFGLRTSLQTYNVIIKSSSPYKMRTRRSEYAQFAQILSISLTEPGMAGFIEYSISL